MLRRIQTVLLSLMLIFVSGSAFGGDAKSKIEMHEKMATHHQKAADCLKAGGSADSCKREMMKDCPMMKAGECPHMDESVGNMSNEEHMKMMKDKKSQKK